MSASAARGGRAFSLATWNVFGAAQGPLALLRGRGVVTPHRLEHPELERALAGVDVVCMQELWLAEAVAVFERISGLSHRVRAQNHVTLWPLTVGGSGLGVASRFPVVRASFRDYSRPHVGVERFARKGIAHARIELPSGVEVDVVTTHLQAGYDAAAARVRARHLRELRAYADEIGAPERPLVVCGDLNLDGLEGSRHREYRELEDAFAGYDDVFADPDHATYHPPENQLARANEPGSPAQRIDYVLLRRSGAHLEVTRKELFLERELPPRGARGPTHASDHYGLLVELALR